MIFLFVPEILVVIFAVLSICADHIITDAMTWFVAHWNTVRICIYFVFILILIVEIVTIIKKEQKQLVGWFSLWNLIRSCVAAQYTIFLVADLAYNYSTMGLGEKLLSALGLQIMIIPLFAYALFEIIIDKMGGISWKSVATGGLVSSVGIGVGATIILL